MMKNKLKLSLLGSLLILAMASCQSKKTDEKAADTPEVPSYPALGNEDLSKLYAATERVDIIFYNLPISVNQDDPSSAKNTALYVSPAKPNITGTACKPIGRLTWISNGVIFREADVYCETGCQYLLFMENNKPVAANAMVQAGADFFNTIISRVPKPKQ